MTRTRTNHPSFGAIQVSRVSGDAELFMSPHKHMHFIEIKLKGATVERSLHEDRMYDAGETYAIINMSEAQWAHMISSLNMGSGTPCTVKFKRTGPMERCPPPPRHVATRSQFDAELKATVDNALELVKEAMELTMAMVNGQTPTKARLKELHDKLRTAHQQGGTNLAFTLEQFERAMDKATQEAKADIEATHLNGLRDIALAAIRQDPELIQELQQPGQRRRLADGE